MAYGGGVRGPGNLSVPTELYSTQVIRRTTRAAAGATPAFITRVATSYAGADVIESWQDSDSAELAAVDGIGRFRAGVFDNTAGVPAYAFLNETELGIMRGAAGELAMTDATAIFFRMTRTGNLDIVTGTGLAVAGTKVVGARMAFITAASGSNLSATVSAILNVLMTHGLTSSS